MSKKVLSLFMALVLCFSTLPTAVLAEEAGAAQGAAEQSVTGTSVAKVGDTEYETLGEILEEMEPAEITLLGNVSEEDLTVYAATTIIMNGYSITGNIYATDSLTLTGGIVDGTVKVDGGVFNITAPSDAEAAITKGLNVVSGSAYVSGAQIGVKVSLTFGGDELTISGSDRAVDLLGIPSVNATIYGATDENGDATLAAEFNTENYTYTIYDSIAKKISTKQAGGSQTPDPVPVTIELAPETAEIYGGQSAEFTVSYNGTDALKAYIQKNGQDDTIDAAYDADTGIVTVTTTEEVKAGKYTLYVHEVNNTLIKAKADITVKNVVAKDSNGNYYGDIKTAVEGAADGSTITVVAKEKQISLPDGIYVETADQGITLDLNGHSLDGYSLNVGGLTATSKVRTGKLTVIDSKGGSGAVGVTVRNGGTFIFAPHNVNTTLLQLTVYGGTVELRGGNIAAGKWELYNSIKLSALIPSDKGYAYRLYYGGNLYSFWVTLSEAQNNTASKNLALAVVQCEHEGADENNNCLYCGTALVAKNGSKYYTSLEAAIAAANENDTVTLLKSVDEHCIIEKNMTIDLNGNEVNNNITIKSGSTLTLAGKGTVKVVQSGTELDGVVGGALNVLSDDVIVSTLSVQQIPNPEMNLSKGTFWEIKLSDNLKNKMTASKLLADGYAFASNGSGNVVDGYVYRLYNVKVVSHTHHDTTTDNKCVCGYTCDHSNGFTDNGKCPDCGAECPHENVNTTTYVCAGCNQQMTVKKETKDGAVTYGTDLAVMMNAAEDTSAVTLLKDTALSDYVYIIDNKKTVTLDLNGHSVSKNGFYTFGIGGTSLDDSGRTGKLIIKGKGDIKAGVTIWSSGVLDLSGWTGTEMYYLGVYGGSTVTGIPDNAHIENMSLSAWQSNDRCVVLNGGSFDSIFWSNESGEPEIMIGYLLEDGYAFQQTDGQFVSYTKILNLSDSSVFNVKVVKCTEHADSDGDGKCDYCNGQIVASVDVKNGGSHIYTDFQDAVDSIAASGIHTVTLLADATGSYTVTQGRGTTIKLNGKTLNEITVSGESNMAFNDSGTVNSVIFSGNAAKFNAGNPLFTISAITVKDGATWSSILPNAELHGYQVYNSDKSSYIWYDAGMLEEFLGDKNTINNVKVQQLPVTKDPILMIDGQEIAEQSSISVYKTFVFSFESYVTNGWGDGVLFIQKDGDSTIEPVEADGDWNIFTCPERTFDISQSGTYTVWAEVSKQGYTRRSKTYTLNVSADLKDAQVTLKQSEFTYTPGTSAGATEFTAEIESVKLFGHDVPADAYTISGKTTGKDAGTYPITITAKEGGDYIGFQTVNWTIHPRVLTEVETCRYVKNYDGTKEITADDIGKNDEPPHFYYSGCPAGGIMLKYGEDYNITNVKANFSKPDAEEYADVSFNVELTNSNYIFKDEYDNEMTSRTVTKGMYIGKANALPTGCEPDSDELIVRNGAAHTYTYDVSKLLKELPNGLNYGTTSYEIETIGSVDNGYIDDGTVSITQNGILTVPVKKVNTEASEEIAIVKVKVIAQNYADFTVTVTVRAKNKLVPTGSPTLSDDAAITYGEKISKISMSGKLHDDTNNVDVEGEFTWNAPDTTPDAGDYEAEWTFMPTGDNAYLYAAATGKATIKVNKAPLTEGADYEKPTAITDLVYKVSDDTPQALHTSGHVIGTFGTMKYTLGDPENAATVWSDTPITSRDAGEFVVYYKVFGDENHLDSAYGTIECSIAKYKLVYKIVCLPKVYDGTKNGDPKNIKSIEFHGAENADITVDFAEKDYTIESIIYDSENVGENLGTVPVLATATVKLSDTKTASNYELAADGNKAYGCITPARIEGIDFHGYTYKVRYIDTYAKTVTVSYFGDVNRADYEIVSDMVSTGDSRIIRTIGCDNTGITFAIADGLSVNDVGKSYTVKVRIYTKDHNYCTDELPFTVVIADKDRPTLSVESIETVYNGKAVSESSISGTAKVNESRIDGTWSFKDGKAPTTVAESGDYTVVFTPAYPDYYYGAEKTVHVTVTPRDIGDKDITFPSGDSFVYTGKPIMPKIYGEYKYDENIEALGLVEDKDYTLVYPEDVKNVGEKTITVTGIGNFSGTTELEYEITPCTAAPTIELAQTEYTYDGNEKKPLATVSVNNIVLTEGKDYEVSYKNNKNAGTASVIITSKGNYGFSEFEKKFTINKANIKVKPKDVTKTYGKEAVFALEYNSELITYEELIQVTDPAFTSDGAAANAPVNETGYEISVLLTNNETDNLTFEVDGKGTLKIEKAPLTIKVNNVNREYGAENPELTVSYDGFVNGEDESVLSGELKLSYDNVDKTTAVGTYTGAAKAEGQTSGNYEITYVDGDVEIVKIPVNISAQTATETYLTIELDRAVEGLGQANFEIKDSDGNSVSLTNVIAAPGNQIYTLRGRFTAGREYTVKITLSGIAADETHRLVNDELVITPVRTNSGGSGGFTTYYTVSFETNGADKISSRNVSKNSVIKEPAAPEKEGYDFAGWYTDKELKEKYDFSSKVTKSFTLYAAWTKKDDLQNQIILTIGKKEAQVFGETKTNDVAPQIVNDRTMLPARFVAENLGADVSWNGEKQLVTITGKHLKTGEDVVILITIGEQSALVNGSEVKLDSPAFVENNRTYTPIRFISEQLGADVEWIAEKQQVVITK